MPRLNTASRLDYIRASTLPGARDPAKVEAFVQWLERAYGEPLPESLGATEKALPWAFREFVRNPEIDVQDLRRIVDHLIGAPYDLFSKKWEAAKEAATQWHGVLAQKRTLAAYELGSRGPVVLQHADGAAWHVIAMPQHSVAETRMLKARSRGLVSQMTDEIRRLSPVDAAAALLPPEDQLQALMRVGAGLGHCYAQRGVALDYLEQGDAYTLYDRRGEPHITVVYDKKRKVLADAKITGDVDVPSKSKWAKHLRGLVDLLDIPFHAQIAGAYSSAELLSLYADPKKRKAVWWALVQSDDPELLRTLFSMNPAASATGLATNPATPADILRALVGVTERPVPKNFRASPSSKKTKDKDWRSAVLSRLSNNPSSPPDLLAKLAGKFSFNIIQNPSSPVDVVMRLLRRNPTRLTLAAGPAVAAWFAAGNPVDARVLRRIAEKQLVIPTYWPTTTIPEEFERDFFARASTVVNFAGTFLRFKWLPAEVRENFLRVGGDLLLLGGDSIFPIDKSTAPLIEYVRAREPGIADMTADAQLHSPKSSFMRFTEIRRLSAGRDKVQPVFVSAPPSGSPGRHAVAFDVRQATATTEPLVFRVLESNFFIPTYDPARGYIYTPITEFKRWPKVPPGLTINWAPGAAQSFAMAGLIQKLPFKTVLKRRAE